MKRAVIISSPGYSRDIRLINASVPLETVTQYLDPVKFASFVSNSFTSDP